MIWKFALFVKNFRYQMVYPIHRRSAMATQKAEQATVRIINDGGGHETVFVNQYTNGILDPNKPMVKPVFL